MGALAGLAFAVGVLLAWRAWVAPRPVRPAVPPLRPRGPLPAGAALGAAAGLLAGASSGSAVLGTAFALPAAWAPVAVARGRARRRACARRELWPDVVDNLASAIRAGMSLPEAVAAVGERGPEELREPFRRFGARYRASGRFEECLDGLKAELADPAADRVVEALRLARQVGGNDLGRLLRTLSGFLRDDARTRAELETRQAWTVNAARLAVAAPWAVLALVSLRPEAAAAYDSPAGAAVLAAGAGVCGASYRLMLALGRLPEDRRVLGGGAP